MFFMLILFFCESSLSQESDFVAQMNADQVISTLASKGLCSSSASARFCRALPWIPSKNEGAIELNGHIYLFLNAANLKTTYPTNEWVEKIPEEKTFEYISYILAMRNDVSESMYVSSIVGLYVMVMEGEGESLKPKSIFLADSGAIKEQATLHEKTIKEELLKPITEWIPPDDFDKSYQFKLIE